MRLAGRRHTARERRRRDGIRQGRGSRFLRSRHAAAAYRLMRVADAPVARDPAHYVELTVELAQDPQRRASLRAEIRERANTHLYDRLEGVEAFAGFALDAIERQQRQDG